jgi:hypothetical protein
MDFQKETMLSVLWDWQYGSKGINRQAQERMEMVNQVDV